MNIAISKFFYKLEVSYTSQKVNRLAKLWAKSKRNQPSCPRENGDASMIYFSLVSQFSRPRPHIAVFV